MELASKEAITRVPHQLFSANLQGEIKKGGNRDQVIKNTGKLSKYCHFCGNTYLVFLVCFVIPLCCLYIRDRDGKLKEADQILAINGQALDQTITHQQAISILQKAKDNVQLVVARGAFPQLVSPVVSRSPSAASTVSAHSNPVSIPQMSVYSVLGMYVLTASSILVIFCNLYICFLHSS